VAVISLDLENTKSFVSDKELAQLHPEIDRWHQALQNKTGPGSEFTGWLDLPTRISETEIEEIQATARTVRENSEAFVSIGIGGSYIGARAGVQFVLGSFNNQLPAGDRPGPEIYFAGHHLSSDYHADLLDLVADKTICLNVISKSGTTTEPAIAFRLFKEAVEKKFGKDEARKRIIVTTDGSRGALKQLADAEGYRSFTISNDVGGRFSVLSPVGLFPLAVAGVDIAELLAGGKEAEMVLSSHSGLEQNPSYLYAAIRHILYRQGKQVELLASFHPALGYFMEWWKQLAGESEGKNQRGIFPASVQYTTDLHSLGQWVQEGNRILFETFLLLGTEQRRVEIPAFKNDADGLNYLAGKSLDFVNDKAHRGTAQAHLEGGVPNLAITAKDRSAGSLGQLFYFFERAVAMTGYLALVNPFDQPGVEFYKKNMFALLGKPGSGKG